MTIEPRYTISLLRFSMVIFDIDNVESSKKFTIVFSYQEFKVDTSSQTYTVPQQFSTATFIGLTDFSAVNASCGLEFNWEYDLPNNRILFNRSIVYQYSTASCGLQYIRVAFFYMKTWSCPAAYPYFNLATNMCDDFCTFYTYANVTAK